MVFELCVTASLFLLAAAEIWGLWRLRKLISRVAALALEVARQKETLEELDPQAGVDAEALEKAFNEGVERIMNYSLSTAMGGGLNG